MGPDKSPVLPMRLLMIALLAFTLWASWKVSNDDAPVVAVAEQTRVAPRRAVARRPWLQRPYHLNGTGELIARNR